MARVRIGTVWDDTTAVLADRAGLLAPVAALAFFLPALVRGAIKAYAGVSTGAAALGLAAALLALVLLVWGQLTVVAVASDPATTRGEASRQAQRRVPAALLVTLIVIAVAIVAMLPVIGVLAASGFDFQAFAARAGSTTPPPIPAGASLFIGLYALALLAASLWLAARLFLLNPVILHERRGIGAIGRSMRLTRGLTWKLIGVALLLGLVWLVATWAARAVVFIVLRLLLGPENIATATFGGFIAAAATGAAFNTVVSVFAARLYAAVSVPFEEAAPAA